MVVGDRDEVVVCEVASGGKGAAEGAWLARLGAVDGRLVRHALLLLHILLQRIVGVPVRIGVGSVGVENRLAATSTGSVGFRIVPGERRVDVAVVLHRRLFSSLFEMKAVVVVRVEEVSLC